MIRDERIDGGKAFDWGRTSEDYARWRDVYPAAFYERIAGLGLCARGQRVLDLGTGTGVLPRNMARYGARFVGADIAENQIAMARRLSAEAGLDIEYVVGAAEALDFAEGSFDAVTACQCFEYFDQARLMPRLHGWLKPGGRVLIAYMGWLPGESEMVRKTEEMILRCNPAWSGAGDVRETQPVSEEMRAWFAVEENFVFDVSIPFSRQGWNGRMKACRGIGASLEAGAVAAFEAEHLAFLQSYAEPLMVPHFVSMLVLRRGG